MCQFLPLLPLESVLDNGRQASLFEELILFWKTDQEVILLESVFKWMTYFLNMLVLIQLCETVLLEQ
ncbi:hypothetical protein O77CONTIG1_04709 [Leptolyngbya sp. O-77]|nr:hypothetical protein O77CONTIG1_04709 [Leptolyngbya sp. O-77]